MEHGQVVIRPALSEPELIEFDGVGTLEAFNTDGLRSLVETLDVPFMKERTLRYPGHIELMRILRETGLFSKEPIQVGDVQVRPLDVMATLLFPKWTFQDMEPDLTVMRVTNEGELEGQPTRIVWNLLDHLDEETGFSSMSRTTGFPCAILSRMILDGTYVQPGVIAPETVGRSEGLLDKLLGELHKRGVNFEAHIEHIEEE